MPKCSGPVCVAVVLIVNHTRFGSYGSTRQWYGLLLMSGNASSILNPLTVFRKSCARRTGVSGHKEGGKATPLCVAAGFSRAEAAAAYI